MITFSAHRHQNPLVDIPLWARLAIIVYLPTYHVLLPLFDTAFSSDPAPLGTARVLVQIFYVFLLLIPFIFYKKDYGWLHPLVFPTLLMLIKTFFKNPWHLIAPLELPAFSFSVATQSTALVLRNLSLAELARAELSMAMLFCTALLVYYAVFFFGPKLRIPHLTFSAPSLERVQLVCLTTIGITIVTTLGLIALQGGLDKHILSLTRPRFEAIGKLGHVIFLISTGTIAAMIWLAYDRSILQNWIFWISTLTVTACVVLANGSRSNGAMFLMMLGMIWTLRTKRIHYNQLALIGLIAFMIFGAFGLIRRDFGAERVNWDVITSLDYSAWINAGSEEAKRRKQEDTDLAAFVGANQHGFLYGKSYVGAIFFWVPRAIWESKPRTADTYNGLQNFMGKSVNYEGRNVGGKPVGPEVESYWNFHFVGTIIIFALLGLFHKWLAHLLLAYREVPAVWVFYVIALVGFEATGKTLTLVTRDIIFLLVLLSFCGCISLAAHRMNSISKKLSRHAR